MPLANPEIRYTVATATPRDARAWSEPTRPDWLASRLAAGRAAAALLAQSGRVAKEIEIVRVGEEGRAGQGVVAQHVATVSPTRVLRVPLSLSISLSHADGHAIAAAAPHPARIGVDLERDGQIAPEHAHYFLSARERREQGTRTLSELWALKESAWKALGCDDATPFSALELVIDGGGCLRAVRLGAMVFPALAEIRHPWPGWVAAILLLQGIAA